MFLTCKYCVKKEPPHEQDRVCDNVDASSQCPVGRVLDQHLPDLCDSMNPESGPRIVPGWSIPQEQVAREDSRQNVHERPVCNVEQASVVSNPIVFKDLSDRFRKEQVSTEKQRVAEGWHCPFARRKKTKAKETNAIGSDGTRR